MGVSNLQAMERQRKFSLKSNLSDTNIFNGEFALSPTGGMKRQNAEQNETVEVNLNQTVVDLNDDVDGDLSESHFESLYGGGNDIDWSDGYDEKYETWLDDYAKKSDLNNALHDKSEVKLFRED
eukprot:13094841-Ditylum_brightwellii.AAC.1